MSELPTPGLLGRMIRLALGLAVAWMAWSLIVDASGFWDGIRDLTSIVVLLAILALVTPAVINELLGRSWGWWPTIAGLGALVVAIVVGATQGDPTGPSFGITLWLWAMIFAFLLGPAFLLAAILGTPGCEMRSYWHLWALLRGRDTSTVACKGWIDRFDHIRLFGRI